ncbi:MAG: hypothetical protein MUE96_10720 [Bacteroidia bacterium]|jgi:hypothetical protein|nr:hypothetical protein [Bacteroidia bacterium]
MKRQKHKYLFLLLLGSSFLLLTLNSCKDECQDPRNPDCENYNPCIDAKLTSAAFTIKEKVDVDTHPLFSDWLMDTDTTYNKLVVLEASSNDASSYLWIVEGKQKMSDIANSNKVTINLEEDRNSRGNWFTITLIVKRNPNTICLPNDDGVDTVTRRLYFMKYSDTFSWEGTYYGSDNDMPNSPFTVFISHDYDESSFWKDYIKIHGLPRGCNDTAYEGLHYESLTYKNIDLNGTGSDSNGINCKDRTISGIYKQGSLYTIRQLYSWRVNGIYYEKTRVFTGIKIK